MHILLTGASGFIGRHVLDTLVAAGHRVTAHSRRADLAARPGVGWLHRPLDEVSAADFAGVDVFMHLASPGVSPRQADWATLVYWNVTVLQRLLEHARSAGVRRHVVAGTFAEFGRAADGLAFIPDDAALQPTYAYAASKAAGAVMASAYAIETGLEFCYLRLFSVFGEGQNAANFWPALRQAARAGHDFEMTAGEQVRDYLPVENAARAFLGAAERTDVPPGRPWVRNVGSGQPVSMGDFARRWWDEWQAPGRLLRGALPYRANEVMRFVPVVDPAVWTW